MSSDGYIVMIHNGGLGRKTIGESTELEACKSYTGEGSNPSPDFLLKAAQFEKGENALPLAVGLNDILLPLFLQSKDP
jgi:hypothetical protein